MKILKYLLFLNICIVFSQNETVSSGRKGTQKVSAPPTSESGTLQLPVITLPSPTAFQMTRYGNVSVNESSGKISPSVPLYTYQAGRLQLPMSMSYQGNGVKVDQAASWTGINWNLQCGGVITRVVRDQDDLMTSQTRYTYDQLHNMDLTPGSSDIELLKQFITNTGKDSEVDMFNYSFPGYSGSFYLTDDGAGGFEAHLTRNDKALKIEIYGPPVDNLNITQGYKREIKITTPEGVAYYFGGLHASEQSRSKYMQSGSYGVFYAQTGFYLSRIEHPLGDEIYFDYESKNYAIKTATSESYTKEVSNSNGCGPSMPSNTLKTDVLNNDIVDGQFLSKVYSNKNDYEIVFGASNESVSNTNYTKKLTSISVRNKNDITDRIKQVNLSYSTFSSRFFLNKVSFGDGTSYEMDYNDAGALPNRLNFDQDHLGYFNNKGNIRLLPQTNSPYFANIYNTLADKSPSFINASKGVMTKLTYPTGGYTKFEYESDDNGYGIRVNKVADHSLHLDGASTHHVEINIRLYEYLSSNMSSSITPRYLYPSKSITCCGTQNTEVNFTNLTSSSINSIYTQSNNERTYKKVRISYFKDLENNGYVEKEFINNVDPLPLNMSPYGTDGIDEFKLPNSRENKFVINGTLLNEKVFSKLATGPNDYRVVSETINEYTTDFETTNVTNNSRSIIYQRCGTYNHSKDLDGLYLGIYKTYSCNIALASTLTKTYNYNVNASLPPEVITAEKSYEYSQYPGLPTKIITKTSEDTVLHSTEYVYPSLGADASYGAVDKLLLNNQISSPIKTTSSLNNGGVIEELSTVQQVYANFNSINSGSNALLSKVMSLKGVASSSNALKDRILYHDYDYEGNPIELSKAYGTKIVYLWGYNKTMPIAKIVNVDFTDIATQLGMTKAQVLNLNETNMDVINGLRATLPNAVISTYTYKPLVGIVTAIDPRGKIITYDYDEFHRLKYVKDNEGNILNAYEYNYNN